jgi:hypothetical protein
MLPAFGDFSANLRNGWKVRLRWSAEIDVEKIDNESVLWGYSRFPVALSV